MAHWRVSMRKIREMLRLRHERGLSHAKIGLSCGVGETTVGDCLSRAVAAGLSWPLPDDLDDEALERRLYPGQGTGPSQPAKPDFSYIHTELRKKSVTLQLLWQEYKAATPAGYQYSQFCQLYRDYRKGVEYSFRNSYKAGEKMFVDYAGQTVPIHCAKTGTVRHAQIFIAVLGASNYTYAEATWSQELVHWVTSHVHAFNFFGGTPDAVIPDNLRSAVNRACRYDPDLNPAYYHMATYYQVAVIPARPRHPKDKAKAENGVLVFERWILAALRKRRFFSLEELNAAIQELLGPLNRRPFRKMPGSRLELFEKLDKPALKPLRTAPYEYANFKLARVGINYHIEVDGHFYSVPYKLVQEKVEVRYTDSIIEVIHNCHRVASHPRSFARGNYTTLREHMPPAHQKHTEWTPERMTRWAGEAGEAVARMASAILHSKPHPEQGFNAILGLIRLGDKHGRDRLNDACAKALTFGSPRYHTVKMILEPGGPRRRKGKTEGNDNDRPTPEHPNIRGRSYYN